VTIIETARLELAEMTPGDAEFILQLLNDPAFIHNIGDRGVYSIDGAKTYIRDRLIAHYREHGYGLYKVSVKETGQAVGMSGLVKRDFYQHPDVGFAFLPQYRSRGYAYESTLAVMNYARQELGLDRIIAVTTAENKASIRLLEKIGLRFETTVQWPEDDGELSLYASNG